MALFDLGKKLGDMAQNAAKKSGEMVELTKLNMSISSEEDSIKKVYTEMGKYCFERFEKGLESDNTIIDLCEKVKNHRSNIETFKEKINQIKNIVICTGCGKENAKTSVFCGNCGTKIELEAGREEAQEEDQEAEQINEETIKDVAACCPACGNQVETNSVFCNECGTRVQSEE